MASPTHQQRSIRPRDRHGLDFARLDVRNLELQPSDHRDRLAGIPPPARDAHLVD
ncbi:hypothetical protein [Agromyces bauzanensis]|uniref:hypothetical protein n=1 Tax=Agromyces bauzanensis TaxID=1308924 RepID=UPI0016652564|nr:hypothetical protein [Agromyces bauzanensis]